MEQTQELLQKWDDRVRVGRLHRGMEISGEGLMLGAGTVLAGMAQDERARPRLALDDEPRAMALLVTAYAARPRIMSWRKCAGRRSFGTKARKRSPIFIWPMPDCRLATKCRRCAFSWRTELIGAGMAPAALMKAQRFDPAPLDLLKANFNQAQLRWPAGNGRDSGRWSGGASVDSAGVKELIARFLLEAARWAARRLRPSETKPPNPEVVKPETGPIPSPAPDQVISTPKPSDFVGQDFGKLGTAIEKSELGIREFDPHAIERMAERGVSLNDLQSTVDHPLIVLQQSRGRLYYLTDKAAVVLNPRGRVITTYSASDFGVNIKTLLDLVHK